MSLWPEAHARAVVISPWSAEALGHQLVYTGKGGIGSAGSITNPTQNAAIYVPFTVGHPIVVAQLWWQNGATANGNVDCGIFGEDGTLIVAAGATAQGTVNVIQAVNITDTPIGPGNYWMGLSSSSATATFFSTNLTIELARALGLLGEASAHPLPAVATFATIAAGNWNGYLPVFGLTTNAVI
jgi:hypothetical protein